MRARSATASSGGTTTRIITVACGISHPATSITGRAALILQVRHQTRLAAYAAHPERFVQGPPRLETLPEAVWINPPAKSTRQDAPGAALVTPDDPQHRVIFGSHVIVGNRPIVLVNSVESLH